jgi:hypothetical protein
MPRALHLSLVYHISAARKKKIGERFKDFLTKHWRIFEMAKLLVTTLMAGFAQFMCRYS